MADYLLTLGQCGLVNSFGANKSNHYVKLYVVFVQVIFVWHQNLLDESEAFKCDKKEEINILPL